MESTLYPDRLAGYGLTSQAPTGADAAETHRIIYDELVHGRVREGSRAALQAIVGRLVDAGAQAVVLGCTELSMILGPADLPVPVLDSTALHVHALLDAALEPHTLASSTVPERGAA
jgi:aspartate racemase